MPLLFTTLFTAGSGSLAPGAPDPDAGFAWTANLLYHFRASSGVFSDTAGTVPAGDGDPVAHWGNQGSSEDAQQSTAARRPLFRIGGLNGRPYLACDQSQQQFFEDLAFTQPSGFTAIDPFTVFLVSDTVVPASYPAVLGAPAANGGKVGFYFRPPAGEQIHFVKSQVRIGTVANPQIVMATIGRNAAGTTSTPAVRLWVRQNGADIFNLSQQTSNLPSTAIAATQFLRSTGIAETGGYFDGRIYEVLLYQGTLDNATTFAIEAFLGAKYAINLA